MPRLQFAPAILAVLIAGHSAAQGQLFPPSPGSTLELLDRRFEVTAEWKSGSGTEGLAWRGMVAYSPGFEWTPLLTGESMALEFFSAGNIEILVKVLAACELNGHHWVFAAGATNVEYRLYVVDRQTGNHFSFWNPLGVASPALTATRALPCEQRPGPPPPEPPDQDHVYRFPGRPFDIWVEWRDFWGNTGLASLSRIPTPSAGHQAAAETAESGLFWFFGWENFELLVKVLDGCQISDHFWVLAAGLTNVEYAITVKDRASGLKRRYENPLGRPAEPVLDTSAFATCDATWLGIDNQLPIPQSDVFTALPGESLLLEVLENDYDPDGDDISIVEVQPPLDAEVSLLPDGRSLSFSRCRRGEPAAATSATWSATASCRPVQGSTSGSRPPGTRPPSPRPTATT
jgi:hypothetical protein